MHPPSSLWKKGSFYSLAGLLSSQVSATHSGNLYQQIIPVVAEDPVRREYPAESRHCSCVRKAGWEGEESWFFFFNSFGGGENLERGFCSKNFFKSYLINVCVPSEVMKFLTCWVLKLTSSHTASPSAISSPIKYSFISPSQGNTRFLVYKDTRSSSITLGYNLFQRVEKWQECRNDRMSPWPALRYLGGSDISGSSQPDARGSAGKRGTEPALSLSSASSLPGQRCQKATRVGVPIPTAVRP